MSGPVSGRAPFHPRFPAADILKFFETADAWLECHELAPACELLDKGPASDPCARALEQLASVLLDAASGTLGLDCQADTGKLLDSSDPRRPGTVAELLELVTGLAATGVADDCRLADRLAGSVKSGGVVVPLAVTVPGPASGGGPTGHASVRGSGK